VARCCIDIDWDLYYCLDKIISQIPLEREDIFSRDKIVKEILAMCKEKKAKVRR